MSSSLKPKAVYPPCPTCGAAEGEPCDDSRDGEETWYCIGYCHDSTCGNVYDTLGNSGLWKFTKNGWEREAMTLENAVARYTHLWERVKGVYADKYRAWYRGRWLGTFQHYSYSRWQTPFAENSEQLSLLSSESLRF